jgi:hypothetical protein
LFIQGRLYSFLGQAVGPRFFLFLVVAAASGLGFVQPALGAAITVASPVSGTTVPSPVWIRAHNTGCNGLTPTAFGYSVDSSSTLVNGVTHNDVDTTAAMSAGKHTIYYKSWVSSGVCPVVSTSFTVAGGSTTSTGTPPSSGSSGSSSTAGIVITSPLNGASGLSSSVWVRAHSSGCGGLASTSFGYSIDNSATFSPGASASDIDRSGVSIGAGTHAIHFKSWTKSGICPVATSTFTVGGAAAGAPPSTGSSALSSLPSSAVAFASLDGLGGWSAEHDTGTPGSSKGSMVYPATTPAYDDAREFYMTYSSGGGERWHISFANNPTATNFALDTYVYVVDPSQMQNLELDLNQVTSDGKTVMLNTQCSSDSKTWEYTVITNGSDHWKPSNVPCNPLTWAAKTWHHIQIGYHRDNSGNVTHDWVNFDGTHSVFSNTTAPASESLGWAKGTLLTNLQIDGLSKGSGSVTLYVHKMTFYHW